MVAREPSHSHILTTTRRQRSRTPRGVISMVGRWVAKGGTRVEVEVQELGDLAAGKRVLIKAQSSNIQLSKGHQPVIIKDGQAQICQLRYVPPADTLRCHEEACQRMRHRPGARRERSLCWQSATPGAGSATPGGWSATPGGCSATPGARSSATPGGSSATHGESATPR